MWIVVAWLGCAQDAEAPPDPCRPGFSLAPDGHCYPPPPRYPDPSVADVLASLPDCVARPPGDGLDLGSGCVDGSCVDGRFDGFVATLGPPEACPTIDGLGEQYECDFGGGRFALFVAPAGRAQPRSSDRAAWIRIRSAFEGADPDGLSVGVGPRCFVEQLGVPDRVEFQQIAGELLVSELRWEVTGPDAGLLVRDLERAGGSGPDGAVDNLYLLRD